MLLRPKQIAEFGPQKAIRTARAYTARGQQVMVERLQTKENTEKTVSLEAIGDTLDHLSIQL